MKKFLKIYWLIVKIFALLIAADFLFTVALCTFHNMIETGNNSNYRSPKQPFKYNYCLEDTEYLLYGITQDEFVTRLAELLAQDTVAHYGISSFKHHVKSDVDMVPDQGRVLVDTVVVERQPVAQKSSHREDHPLFLEFPDVFIVDTTVHQSRVPSLGLRQFDGIVPSSFDDNDIDTLSVGTFFFVENETGPLCYCFSFFVPQDSIGCSHFTSRYTDRGNKSYEGKVLMSVVVVDEQPLRLLLGRNYEVRAQNTAPADYFARHYLDPICQYDRQRFKNACYSWLNYYTLSDKSLGHFYFLIMLIPVLIFFVLLGIPVQLLYNHEQRNQ